MNGKYVVITDAGFLTGWYSASRPNEPIFDKDIDNAWVFMDESGARLQADMCDVKEYKVLRVRLVIEGENV